jgi:hypothetical protein
MHVALLGDSIFDNGSYVSPGSSVTEQLKRRLPAGAEATLLAVDGASSTDAIEQLPGVPPGATHLFLSCGGNDALNESDVLGREVGSVRAAIGLLGRARARFAANYARLVDAVCGLGRPVTVCTVYDGIPVLGETERTALTAFNDVILRVAFARHAAVIDLRLLCSAAGDYSEVSPIEPSAAGAHKIARAVLEVAMRHDFSRNVSAVYF